MPFFQRREVQQEGRAILPGGLHCEQQSRDPHPQGRASSASVWLAQGSCDHGEWSDGQGSMGTFPWPRVAVLSLLLVYSV